VKKTLKDIPVTPLPDNLAKVVRHAVETARKLMRKPGTKQLAPILFLGNDAEVHVIGTGWRDVQEKEAFAEFVRARAREMNATFALLLSESWTIDERYLHLQQEIMAKYGSIGESPYKVDCMAFTLETKDGTWAAMPKIIKRNFGEPQFRKLPTTGRFAHFLPKD
jgi:hypothetical protein